LSVSDKTDLVKFARALTALDVPILSTGGTFRTLEKEGIPVKTVESYTGSPEVMDGRVKTLHPRIHGGILAREGVDDRDLERIGASFIDLVVVNLYPFEKTLATPGASFGDLLENIDIGGPCMVRAAAKNHERVAVVCDPGDYDEVVRSLKETGDLPVSFRRRLAQKAFLHTSEYDAKISGWLNTQVDT
jgi:phosphoribosylaminoimidazolecarboxamide formyltransferase/IMP cyclohydrolase